MLTPKSATTKSTSRSTRSSDFSDTAIDAIMDSIYDKANKKKGFVNKAVVYFSRIPLEVRTLTLMAIPLIFLLMLSIWLLKDVNREKAEERLIVSISRHTVAMENLIVGFQGESDSTVLFLSCSVNCSKAEAILAERRKFVDELISEFVRSRGEESNVDQQLLNNSTAYGDNLSLLRMSLPDLRKSASQRVATIDDTLNFFHVILSFFFFFF